MLQTIIYNHALLTLWGSDSLAMFVDIDEYLMTSRPGVSAAEAYVKCGQALQPCQPVAGLQVRGRGGGRGGSGGARFGGAPDRASRRQ